MFEKLYTLRDGVLYMRASEAGQMQVLEEASKASLSFDFEGNPRFPRKIIQTGQPISYSNKGQVINVPAGSYLAAYRYAALDKNSAPNTAMQAKADKMEDYFIRPILPETAQTLMDSFITWKEKSKQAAIELSDGKKAFISVFSVPKEKSPLDGKKPITATRGVFEQMVTDTNSVSLYRGQSDLKDIRYILKDTPLTVTPKDGKGLRFNKRLAAGQIVALVDAGAPYTPAEVYLLAPSEVKKTIACLAPQKEQQSTLSRLLKKESSRR